MRLLLHLFGREVVDLVIGEPEADESSEDSRGSFTSYPVGFVRDARRAEEDHGRDYGYGD